MSESCVPFSVIDDQFFSIKTIRTCQLRTPLFFNGHRVAEICLPVCLLPPASQHIMRRPSPFTLSRRFHNGGTSPTFYLGKKLIWHQIRFRGTRYVRLCIIVVTTDQLLSFNNILLLPLWSSLGDETGRALFVLRVPAGRVCLARQE